MRTIAIVEDNPDNRLLARAILGDRYHLLEYADGKTALEGILAERPDLVLLDISLPEMDGSEVLGRLRREPSLAALPVIALTAHAMVGDREKYLAAGFDRYISKPILEPRELMQAIDELLAERGATDEG